MWTDSWTNFDPQNTDYPTPNLDVTANITTDTHWTSENTYYLRNQIYVKNNATLTIDPGVIIRADHTAIGAGLFVTKGSKVIAIGTAENPIVFTSDNAIGKRKKGDWGGIVLLGKSTINIYNGFNNIEGISLSRDTEYGGGLTPNDNDNSGVLKYVRIEFAGYVYATNQEINALTFGAVGRETTIDYIQVSHSNDDSFEWFGGTVNCNHLVSFRCLDDDFDTDNGYSGDVQFCLGVRDPQVSDNPLISTSEGFESDNNYDGSSAWPFTSAIFSNCTMVGPTFRLLLPNGGTLASGHKRIARLRKNTKLQIHNSVFMDYLEGIHIDGIDAETNAVNNELKFRNNVLINILRPSKTLSVNAPGTITSGNNPAFNMVNWFTLNNNTEYDSHITNTDLMIKPYDLTDATIYTGLDYRPTQESILASGADFGDKVLTLKVNDIHLNSEFNLKPYPNPSSTNFKLNSTSSSNEDVEITIYDFTGKLIESRHAKYEEVNDQKIGNNYNTGVYMISLKQGEMVKTVKVIKN